MSKRLVECKSVPCLLHESVASDLDDLVKTLPQDCRYQTKAYAAEMMFEKGERAEVSVITTMSVDLSGEVVIPRGLNRDKYSGVVLYNHSHDLPSVGKSLWVKDYSDSVRAKTVYPPREEGGPEDTPFYIDQVWDLVLAGVLPAKSIGFLPLTPKRDPTAEELELHPEWKGAGVWADTLLLEYSVCNVGVNPEALMQAINTKSVSMPTLHALGLEVPEVREEVCEPAWVTRAKQDDCVSRKIPKLLDEGYPHDQAVAIAYSLCHAKAVRPQRKKKRLDINAVVAKALEGLRLDVDRIAQRAVKLYENRNRV